MPQKYEKYQQTTKKSLQSISAFQDHFSSFNQKIDVYGLRLVDIVGDGNCLFRAIGEQLEGQQKNHMKYRKISVNEIKKNQQFYQGFLPDSTSIQIYLDRMSQEGVWGGHFELQALCNSMKINIAVHSFDSSILITGQKGDHQSLVQFVSSCLECFQPQEQNRRTINIAYHKGNNIVEHYSSIRYQDDDNKQAEPLQKEALEDLLKINIKPDTNKNIQLPLSIDNDSPENLEREIEKVPLQLQYCLRF